MVGKHYCINGHEFEQAPGDGEGLESLLHCSLWGCKELGMTEQLNNNNSNICYIVSLKTVPLPLSLYMTILILKMNGTFTIISHAQKVGKMLSCSVVYH